MPVRVLIVDDNRDAADSLGLLLELLGLSVRVSYDGPDALRQAADFRPHAGLFDIDMPGMTGLDLARAMRERQGDGPLLLVAVTGVSTADATERATTAGFDRIVTKPANGSELVRMLLGFYRANFPGGG